MMLHRLVGTRVLVGGGIGGFLANPKSLKTVLKTTHRLYCTETSRKPNPSEGGEKPKFQGKRLIYFGSLCLLFKVAYDLASGFFNYRKLTALDRLQSVWNEAVVSVFYEVIKDPEVAKVFGTPVVMGAPPAQSVSPLTITNNGLEFESDLVVGPFSIFSSKNSYPTLSPTQAQEDTKQHNMFNEDIITRKETSIVRTAKESVDDILESLPTVKLPALVGYMMVTVPVVGKKARGKLHVLTYTDPSHEWAVKYAKVTKDDGTMVKEIVSNHYVPGIPAKM